MQNNNLTPTEILNNRYQNLIGIPFDELTLEIGEQISRHKEQLLNYLEEPNEIRAYIEINRYEIALPFAVIEIDGLCHTKENDGKFNHLHNTYCRLFQEYIRKFFIWENIEKYLQSITDIKSKIIYLTCLKIQIDLQARWWHNLYDETRKLPLLCSLEIAKLESQLLYEKDKKMDEIKRTGGGSQYQNLLAMHYLLEYLKAKGNKKAKARFAAFLTGFSENTLYNDSFNIHAKQDEDGVKWEKDMELVKNFFADLGLDEIVRMIKNDLDC